MKMGEFIEGKGADLKSRLGDCEVCAKTAAKYTCPECEVKTCSLPCVRIHKSELDCAGVRSRVKFRRLNKMSDLDILSDYRLLEETNRAVEVARKTNFKLFNEQRNFFQNRKKGSALLFGAHKKEVGLKLLPMNFTEHKNNSTRYNRKANEFMWKVKWIFPQADDYQVLEHKVVDSALLGDAVSKYLIPDQCEDAEVKEKLSTYLGRELHRVEILLPAQGVPGGKFFLMNPLETVATNLKYKNVIEHPTFYVIFEEKLHEYEVVHIVTKSNNLLECNEDVGRSDDEIDTNELV